jgi:hypothetical protein
MTVNLQTGSAWGTDHWTEDGNQLQGFGNDGGGLGARIQALGSQGWELVGDAVYSNKMNLNNTRTMAANGVSTAEMFTFKRRKP